MSSYPEFIPKAGACMVSKNVLSGAGRVRWMVRVASQAPVDPGVVVSSIKAAKGFGGNNTHYAPELSHGKPRVKVPEGVELMRIRPDGTQEDATVFYDQRWRVIAEQPGPAQ